MFFKATYLKGDTNNKNKDINIPNLQYNVI